MLVFYFAICSCALYLVFDLFRFLLLQIENIKIYKLYSEISKGLQRLHQIGSAVAGFNHARTIRKASATGLDERQYDYNKGICSPGSLVNKDHKIMRVDPMFMIVQSLRSFLTAVTPPAVAPIAVILPVFTKIYLNIPIFT